jgi:F0F1-type ATP synthase assembly protein I
MRINYSAKCPKNLIIDTGTVVFKDNKTYSHATVDCLNIPLYNNRALFMENSPEKQSDRQYYLFALKIVSDFGASIAVPVVLFVLAGQWLDERYAKTPLFTIIGFVLAAVLSGKIIYRKAKLYGKQYQNMK